MAIVLVAYTPHNQGDSKLVIDFVQDGQMVTALPKTGRGWTC